MSFFQWLAKISTFTIAFEMMIHLILLILRLIFEVKSSNSTPNFTLLDADISKIDEKFKKKDNITIWEKKLECFFKFC